MTPIERAARALGEVYDGFADPVETPQNWARAVDGVRAVIAAICQPSEVMRNAVDKAIEGRQLQQAISIQGYLSDDEADVFVERLFNAMLEEG